MGIDLGRDAVGNITRINNAPTGPNVRLEESNRKLQMLNEHLENAKIEVQRPFPQEQALNEKQMRLSELNDLLKMGDRSSEPPSPESDVSQEQKEVAQKRTNSMDL